jgi:hypothetical protein
MHSRNLAKGTLSQIVNVLAWTEPSSWSFSEKAVG